MRGRPQCPCVRLGARICIVTGGASLPAYRRARRDIWRRRRGNPGGSHSARGLHRRLCHRLQRALHHGGLLAQHITGAELRGEAYAQRRARFQFRHRQANHVHRHHGYRQFARAATASAVSRSMAQAAYRCCTPSAARRQLLAQLTNGPPYAPPPTGPTAIPTLDTWAMMLLATLLGGFGAWRVRRLAAPSPTQRH